MVSSFNPGAGGGISLVVSPCFFFGGFLSSPVFLILFLQHTSCTKILFPFRFISFLTYSFHLSLMSDWSDKNRLALQPQMLIQYRSQRLIERCCALHLRFPRLRSNKSRLSQEWSPNLPAQGLPN